MSQRDYTNWVEGRGDGAKPHDYSPEKYQTQAWCTSDGTWYDFGETGRPSWSCGAPYRVRLRRQEPDAQSAPEPPILKSLVIRPDGCVVLIGGTSVKISHSAALDLAGELCLSRRQ